MIQKIKGFITTPAALVFFIVASIVVYVGGPDFTSLTTIVDEIHKEEQHETQENAPLEIPPPVQADRLQDTQKEPEIL